MFDEGTSIVVSPDGTVRIIESRIAATTTYERFAKEVSLGTLETPVLPLGTIMVRFKGIMSAYFITVPPKLRNIEYRMKDERPRMLQLMFPWIVFGLKFQGKACVEVFARAAKTLVTSPRSELFMIPLPNSDVSGKRCMGPEFGMTVNTAGSSLAEVAMAVLNYFDGSCYNRDLPEGVYHLPPEMLHDKPRPREVLDNLVLWEEWSKTLKVPQDACKASWEPTESFGVFAGKVAL